jgi:hypothetical protein
MQISKFGYTDIRIALFVCFCFESHEQFFSYLATVTIAGDRATNLDLLLSAYGF